MKNNTKIKVAVADDHVLLRRSLVLLINTFETCEVVCEADNGQELISQVMGGTKPDVLILDQNMPKLNGFETAQWLFLHHPHINILMLSQFDSELSMVKLLQVGVKGFLKKDIEPPEFRSAIEIVATSEFYFSKHINSKLINVIVNKQANNVPLQNITLNEVELKFIKLSSTELTCKSIGAEMNLRARYLEQMREDLFKKLQVQTRVGLVMVALKHGLISF